MVRRPSVHHFLMIFSKIAWQIKAKYDVEPLCVGGTIVYSRLFSSPEPTAHRWACRIPMDPASVRPSASVIGPFTFSNIFSSETAWPIKVKFYVEHPWEGGMKVYINGPGHMTKMAATPIYGKNRSKIFFSRTGGPIFTKFGM